MASTQINFYLKHLLITDLFSIGNKYTLIWLKVVLSVWGELKHCMCLYKGVCAYVYMYTLEKIITSAEMRR